MTLGKVEFAMTLTSLEYAMKIGKLEQTTTLGKLQFAMAIGILEYGHDKMKKKKGLTRDSGTSKKMTLENFTF